ncbi:MAG: ABC transporter ATP-binding protein [Chloroflexota bacterium]
MSTPVIELRDASRTYRTGSIAVQALRGVSLRLDDGEMVAIMGPSGSGKSTMMNTLGLLDRPTGGAYLLDGVDVARLHDGELARLRNEKIGFVFQSFNLLARTSAVRNVELPLLYRGARARRDAAMTALERVGLGKRAGHVPSQLSGGEQQRVAVARALVTHPRLLLADEPTGNLDTRTSMEVMALLQELNTQEGVLVVVVTHEQDIAACCSRVVTMRDGRVESDEPVRERLWAAQALAAMPAEGAGVQA